jgi:hypothetical protein
MATIKSYTDISQSQKLVEILPLESADMFLAMNGTLPVMSKYIDDGFVTADDTAIPCWSLASLLGVFPYYEINNNGVNIQLSVKGEALITEEGECLLDLIVNMIIHLNELKML